MVSLSATPDFRAQWRDAGRLTVVGLAWLFYAAGWLSARTLRVAGIVIAAPFFAAGWFAARVAWPALCWCGRAARTGWDEGRKPRTVDA